MMIQVDHNYVESLTERERVVLQLLGDGLSNREIAEALVIEVSTVKWYNYQIYDKLHVKNRQQAVARGRTLGILAANGEDHLQGPQHNLPADTLPFIGRARELDELIQQLTDDNIRLITILGPGGIGKSRLSIDVGRRMLGYFRDGVYFVSLAAAASMEHIMTTIAVAIGFRFHSELEPRQHLLAHLKNRHLLLIIDGFEHLLEHGSLLTDILHATEHVKVLATSHEKLNLAGEALYFIDGLSVPDEHDTQNFGEYDAIKLFIEIAQRAGQHMNENEIEIAASICRLLGGIPLAIQLAAAWADTLSVADIEAEIRQGLDILETSLHDLPERHHSIRAVFDYSWDRLEAQAQAAFIRLSVFRGGFTREAAQAVAGASLRDLQRLIHSSFVQHQSSGRYAIQELTRQYGETRLAAAGKLQEVHEQHAQFFAETIRPLGEATFGMFTREMLEAVDNDYENLRAAWLFQAERRDIAELRRFMDGLCMFFDSYNRNQEGVDLFEPLLSVFAENSDDDTLFRGQLMARLSWCYSEMGLNQKSLELAEQALEILLAFDAAEDLMFLYFGVAQVSYRMNKIREGADYTEKLFALAQTNSDSKWHSLGYLWKYMLDSEDGDPEEVLRWIEPLPDNTWKTFFRAVQYLALGDYAQAEALLVEGLNTYWLSPVHYLIWYGLMVDCVRQAGAYDRAWRYVQRGLHYGDSGYYAWATFILLGSVIPLLIAENQYTHAVELVSLMLHHPANPESHRNRAAAHRETLAASLPIDEFEAAWTRGRQLDLADIITYYMER
jgi:predicted ATPase/DNA-binding CsgD family transcriptional regulator